jgi:peptide subunit release factor 1 (eRF1)
VSARIEGAVDLRARLTALARIDGVTTPVVSVYLDTRWTDEHERERARIFLRNELNRARQAGAGGAHPDDLDWIERQGGSLIEQSEFPDAHGVALFACQALSLREVLPVRAPFENQLVVAPTPFLLPLAAVLDDLPGAVVVFVDTEHARLVPLDATGPAREVVLEAEVPGRHSRGGWAQLAQSRYQRHIQDHRDRHFEAVLDSLAAVVDAHGVERIVLAGEPRNLAVFRGSLPAHLARKIVGMIEGARHEASGAFVARATELLGHVEDQRQAESVDAALTEAAKSRQAVASVDEALEAINRGAVHRLYIAKGFASSGHACGACRALSRGEAAPCRFCGGPTAPVDLAEAMSDRVLAAGGHVSVIDLHADLAKLGGVAALLRYPL